MELSTLKQTTFVPYQSIQSDDETGIHNDTIQDVTVIVSKRQSVHSNNVILKLSLIFMAILFAILLGLNFFVFVSSPRTPLMSSPSRSIIPRIDFDRSNNIYRILDSSTNMELARGSYISNYNRSGWHYLSVEASDLPMIKEAHRTTQDASDLLSEAYLDRMTAIGYLEGYITCKDISSWYINFYSGLFDGGDPTEDALDFLESNYNWMKMMSEKHWRYNEHWMTVRGFLAQLDGMTQGYSDGCTTSLSSNTYSSSLKKRPPVIHFLLMNSDGDLYQIAEKFNQRNQPPSDILPDYFSIDDKDLFDIDYTTSTVSKETTYRNPIDNDSHRPNLRLTRRGPKLMTANNIDTNEDIIHPESNNDDGERITLRRKKDHCSAIVKLLPDKSDVLFAHNTWDDYQLMSPRIIKHTSHSMLALHKESDSGPFTYHIHLESGSYDLPENERSQLRHEVYFSSSPGLLTSVDDFYTLSGRSNMAVTETSLDIYNHDLLNLIHPETLLSWMRCLVSNQLAVDGTTWAQLFTAYHSGTYANEWMMINYDRFTPGQAPLPGFLTVLEEVPGYVHYDDLTSHLTIPGYWASYNNPFFDDIFILSGYLDECVKDSTMCHAKDPRALLFQHHQQSVIDVPSLLHLIDYNRFQVDELSFNDSCNAISCRSDLHPNPLYRYPFGAIDGKVSSVMLSKKQSNGTDRSTPLIYARLGPTTDDQQPFCWSQFDSKRNIRGKRFSHAGHPSCYDYHWQTFPPSEQ